MRVLSLSLWYLLRISCSINDISDFRQSKVRMFVFAIIQFLSTEHYENNRQKGVLLIELS